MAECEYANEMKKNSTNQGRAAKLVGKGKNPEVLIVTKRSQQR